MSRRFLSLFQVLRQPRKVVRQSFRYPRKTVMATLGIEPRKKETSEQAEASPLENLIPPDIFSRLPVSYHETVHGNYFLPCFPPDDFVASTIRSGQIFEPHVVKIAETYAKPGTMILDAGANFGQMSILFSRLVGEQGMVLSFEAQAYCLPFCKKISPPISAETSVLFMEPSWTRAAAKSLFPNRKWIASVPMAPTR